LDGAYCGTPGLGYEKHIYSSIIEERYQWALHGNWTLQELKKIHSAGTEIEQVVDKITGGSGLKWMNDNLGNTLLTHHGDLDFGFFKLFPSNVNNAMPGWFPELEQNTIFLKDDFSSSTLIHELGHIWDINTGVQIFNFEGAVRGVGDALNTYIGGDIHIWGGFRFTNPGGNPTPPSSHIPPEYRFDPRANGGYGNGATADYLAESFKYLITNPNYLPSSDVGRWLEIVISLQTSAQP
jgi:hypothetical protein